MAAAPLPPPAPRLRRIAGAASREPHPRAVPALGTAPAGRPAASSPVLTGPARGDGAAAWAGKSAEITPKPSPVAEAPRGEARPVRDTSVGTPRCQTARYLPPLGNSSSPSPWNIPSLSAPRYSVPVGSM